jgi:hypothetical protein
MPNVVSAIDGTSHEIQIPSRWSVAEHKQYKAGALKGKRQVKLSGNILKITLLSFEITGIHMHNMYKSVEK